MKKIIWTTVLVLVLVLAAPVSGASKETVGDRIGIYYDGAQTFPAGQPFFIRHGFVNELSTRFIGLYHFAVEVDGILLEPDFKTLTVDTGSDPAAIVMYWVYNFPDGMTGAHTFTGRWFRPCTPALGDVCETPSDVIEGRTSTVVITFE